MNELEVDIEAYGRMRNELETTSMGKWVLIQDAKVIVVTNSFEEAAVRAVTDFGDGPYLIRQIGSSGITLSASVMYRAS